MQVSSLRTIKGTMVNFCQPGGDLVSPSEIVTLGQDGPFRLTIRHSRGVIVEYFPTISAALHRQGALEDMLSAVAFHGAVQIPRHTDSLRAAPNALLYPRGVPAVLVEGVSVGEAARCKGDSL